ncbi:hypothetical protein [Allocoleopsis franciscana]|nr:hypothetical protein [Allocoleopsis franciscana]
MTRDGIALIAQTATHQQSADSVESALKLLYTFQEDRQRHGII